MNITSWSLCADAADVDDEEELSEELVLSVEQPARVMPMVSAAAAARVRVMVVFMDPFP
ncbi:hypothetical protein [Curtobacterium flaccumfaciens]|uniref:hypothetical protein n=1 Tax=Curtobacterium flaccumfaciens TaxID=2035 RepID=UPI0039A2AC2D